MANYAANFVHIYSVSKLKNIVMQEKERKKSPQGQLDSILQKRKLRRDTIWTQENREKYDIFLQNLYNANHNFVYAFKNTIEKQAYLTLYKNIEAKSFTIWNPQNIKCNLGNFKPSTIYNGFWCPDKRTHDRLPHHEANIRKTPFEQVRDELLPHGYKIVDISDRNKSFNTVIQVYLL